MRPRYVGQLSLFPSELHAPGIDDASDWESTKAQEVLRAARSSEGASGSGAAG